MTAQEYEAALTANLTGLLDRFKSGRYRAPPVRRVHIPKEGTNKIRPIGISTLEDDARRLLDVLSKRLGRFGLTLPPEKTRLVDFRRPDRRAKGTQRERSFDMPGLTH